MNYQKPTEHIEEEDVKRLDLVTVQTSLILRPYIVCCNPLKVLNSQTRKVLLTASSYTMLTLDSVV